MAGIGAVRRRGVIGPTVNLFCIDNYSFALIMY
jgi:hypothetical protein